MKTPYLDLHFKFHDFFLCNNEDMKILSCRFFSVGAETNLVKFLFKVYLILRKILHRHHHNL